MAAGTTSHHNPAYLLAKIGKQSFKEDPKYLPIIMLNRNLGGELFYHYRQYKISKEPPYSIFVYPAAELSNRGASFTVIESFVNSLSSQSDPRSMERGTLLAKSVIHPFLKSVNGNNSDNNSVNFVDLGGGSGIMVSYIWGHILAASPLAREKWNLSCSIVSLKVQNPAKHFSRGSIVNNMDYMTYEQADYADWINKQDGSAQYDIALVCRLLNNISFFDIEGEGDEGMLWNISGKKVTPDIIINKKYNPVLCLEINKRNINDIIHTNGKTRLSDSHVAYRTLSLSDYYKAMAFCLGKEINDELIYYPVRKFNDQSLLNCNNESLLGKLSASCKMIVIED